MRGEREFTSLKLGRRWRPMGESAAAEFSLSHEGWPWGPEAERSLPETLGADWAQIRLTEHCLFKNLARCVFNELAICM
jgi:hypothetical protein